MTRGSVLVHMPLFGVVEEGGTVTVEERMVVVVVVVEIARHEHGREVKGGDKRDWS